MPKDEKPSSWLIDQLAKERETFNDDVYPLNDNQNKRFESYLELLREDENSINKGSIQRTSRRRKVRMLLRNIFLSLGVDVFLLCTLSTSITELAQVQESGLIQHIGDWWKTDHHPPKGLLETAAIACKTHSIKDLLSMCGKNAFKPSIDA
jgi:hypothetical protein